MSDRLLTILQAAQQFNLTTRLLYAAVANGDLAAIRFRPRGRIRLCEADVRRWIEGHASGTRRDVFKDLENRRSTVADIEQLLPPKALRRFA